jgi:hypothetical protein
MKLKQTILKELPKHLFWDFDPQNLDVQTDMDLIIPRALFATNNTNFDEDITRLEKVYSPSEIVETLKNTKERISNSLCLLVAQHYKIPPFLRYTR